jgi:hypothetical protein
MNRSVSSSSVGRKGLIRDASKSRIEDEVSRVSGASLSAEAMLEAKAHRKRAEGDLQLLANR